MPTLGPQRPSFLDHLPERRSGSRASARSAILLAALLTFAGSAPASAQGAPTQGASGETASSSKTAASAAKPARAVDAPGRATGQPLPEIQSDASKLPPLVARMREAIIEAAKSGDVEKLRLALERNEMPPLLSKGQTGDPIAGLKARSGDGDGRETMGILLDVIEAPYVHVKPGTAEEMYVWPWFAAYPLDKLDAEQRVEVYRILRAAEFKASLATGRYSSWRLGIGPDDTWHYFLTGD